METIDASVRELAGVSRLGIVKKKRNKRSRKHYLLSMFTLVQRYPLYPDSCLSKVNVWAMSSLLGVW